MAETATRKIQITPIVLSVIVFAGMLFAVQFAVKGFLHERAVYASLRTQIDDIQSKRDQLMIAQMSAQSVHNDVSRISKAFIDEPDVLNVLVPLEQEATSKGIAGYKVTAVQDISFSGAGKPSAALQGTTLRIEGTGTLANLFAFVQTLQKLPYFLRIESLQIQRAGATPTGQAPLQAVIIVKFFMVSTL